MTPGVTKGLTALCPRCGRELDGDTAANIRCLRRECKADDGWYERRFGRPPLVELPGAAR